MDATFVTYQSANAVSGKEWIAWIHLNGEYLPVYFFGTTETEAHEKAEAEWEKHRETRERNIASREEGRKKAAETRARKKAQAND
jgi:hypothetical protein